MLGMLVDIIEVMEHMSVGIIEVHLHIPQAIRVMDRLTVALILIRLTVALILIRLTVVLILIRLTVALIRLEVIRLTAVG